jgi:SAM-dependent methyltransferase
MDKALRLIGPRPALAPRRAETPAPWLALDHAPPPRGSAHRALLMLFAGTLLTSALLLFTVQPMVGKLTLPLLGGTPAVWNTCMVFFQGLLLAGYLYAHLATRYLTTGRHALLHGGLMLLPLFVLPIAEGAGSAPAATQHPALWLLGRLTMWVGLPFFVVSTTAPLLQRWFSRTDHPHAHDPYFLYTASNLGSLIALLGYPLLIEPMANLGLQGRMWMYGYIVLTVLAIACGAAAWRRTAGHEGRGQAAAALLERASDAAPSWRERGYWIFAAFVPSSLMLGVTTHITTDLAPMPLLWVVPLAIYLLTFVLVFARKPPITHALACRLMPLAIVPAGIFAVADPPIAGKLQLPIHLAAFFFAAMVCHGALAARRPRASRLTEFYLWMSVGGVLGGLMNAMVAPVLFDREFGLWTALAAGLGPIMDRVISPVLLDKFVEYPAAMLLACLLLPRATPSGGRSRYGLVIPLAIAAATSAAFLWNDLGGGPRRLLPYLLPVMLCLCLVRRPARMTATLALVMLCSSVLATTDKGDLRHASRNFFGGKRVYANKDGYHVFYHGQTTHGFQHPGRPAEPLAYYHRSGPAADIFAAHPAQAGDRRVALIGLGIGAMAAYADRGDRFTFFEIDPQVEDIAADRRLFTFLDDCRGDADVVLGDGRLRLREFPDETFNLVVLDAFSSDAIPVHLLTREAIALYLSKLAPGGALVFHVSNNYLDLAPLLARLAEDAGLVARIRRDHDIPREDLAAGRSPCEYVILARTPADLGAVADDLRWTPMPSAPATPLWTDDFSNVLSVIRW